MAQSLEAVGAPFPARANCGDGPNGCAPPRCDTAGCLLVPLRGSGIKVDVDRLGGPVGCRTRRGRVAGHRGADDTGAPSRRSRLHSRVSSARAGLGLIGRDDELGELDQFMAGCGRYALAAGMFLQIVLPAWPPGASEAACRYPSPVAWTRSNPAGNR